jgi:hypothetical protein
MSTLRCTNLQDTAGSNSLTTAQIYNGAAKAWVNFSGTGTVAIRAQFNVSSITDNGTGDYTVNFTTALADANYCFTSSVAQDLTGGNQGKTAGIYTTPSSGSCRVSTGFMEGSPQFRDCERVFIAIFR